MFRLQHTTPPGPGGVVRRVAIVGGVLVAGALPLAEAGDFHHGPDLKCSSCHTIHYSEGGSVPTGAGTSGPYKHLLLNSGSELCLSCHDGGDGSNDSPPDVLSAAGYESSAVKRSAGSFPTFVGTATDKGHNLGVANDEAPGSNPTVSFTDGLKCSICHAVHGNSNYRNLSTDVGNATGVAVTYVTGSYDGLSSVRQQSLNPTSTHYATSNVEYRLNTLSAGVGNWCKSCHTRMHGSPGDTNTVGGPEPSTPWLRHPTMGVSMSQAVSNGHVDADHWFSALNSRVPVVSASGTLPGTAGSSDNQPFCGTCHKAHGSDHKFALIYDDSSTSALEDGTKQSDLCQQCHLK